MSKQIGIVTDIFGHCRGLEQLLQDLAEMGHHQTPASRLNITVIDPYQQQTQSFSDEQQAYAAYSEQCGHDNYASIVARAIQQPVDLAIGFSAGASALWRALSTPAAANIKQAMLFYPGQIHHHLKLTPDIPASIIFGASEPHFNVDSMLQLLSQKPSVNACKTAYQHGFMNLPSAAFNAAGYQHYLNVIKEKSGWLLNTPTNTAATTAETR
ncbi:MULTISPECIES: hypothetical protein [unclassified Arsukibacterium]|uniref:hypothetical protein n=1 Tax=unclassified Arsukibacterium TaxID=2635278 RepID=UPI000C6BA9FB|nr:MULTISPECIES: hypothetical protein [unclassified Arsukibacterium]MAA96289.1 hypothetical protein [Rheinheimera sp.]MBM34583.1 hypothetical protein [Rheinheimera sp.]